MSTRPHPESARIIREARQAAGLTQKELAEKLDVTTGTIGYYERGVGQPKTENTVGAVSLYIQFQEEPPVFPPAGAFVQKNPGSLVR